MDHLQASIFSVPVQTEQTYLTMLEMTAFSELVECLSLTTIQGTQVWAGLSFSVASANSYMNWLPSLPVAQVLMVFQSRPYLVAHRWPWALKSVVLSSRQRAKGRPWLQQSNLRMAHASIRLPWHSRTPCWQVKAQLDPFWARLALPQGQRLNSQIFQKSFVLAAVLSDPRMKARQSGHSDSEQRSIFTLPAATCRLLLCESTPQQARRATEARRTLNRTALLDISRFLINEQDICTRTNVTIVAGRPHTPFITMGFEGWGVFGSWGRASGQALERSYLNNNGQWPKGETVSW